MIKISPLELWWFLWFHIEIHVYFGNRSHTQVVQTISLLAIFFFQLPPFCFFFLYVRDIQFLAFCDCSSFMSLLSWWWLFSFFIHCLKYFTTREMVKISGTVVRIALGWEFFLQILLSTRNKFVEKYLFSWERFLFISRCYFIMCHRCNSPADWEIQFGHSKKETIRLKRNVL